MLCARRILVAGAVALGLAALPATRGTAQPAAGPPPPGVSTGELLFDLLPYKAEDVQLRALAALEARGDRSAIPALIEILRFEPSVPVELPVGVLEKLSGQAFGAEWGRWVEWLQKQTDITPPPEFLQWKGRLLSLIDPEFLEWFQPGVPYRVRLEEIVWGGVAKDGIPALTNPAHLPAAQAAYLTDDELVFGVTLNGESRAYPHRFMDWHEMANDVVGGVPVALAY
jgi:hypothetical protein